MTENYANPSALHTAGQDAERLVKQARQQIAASLGTKPGNIVFTSGGTEADNLALFSAFYAGGSPGAGTGSGPAAQGRPQGRQEVRQEARPQVRQGGLLVSAVEHPAVLSAADALAVRGVRVERIPVHGVDTDYPGMVDATAFRSLLAKDVALVSVMHVNNEIGTIQPIEELTRIASMYNSERGAKIRFHVDAVQSFGKLTTDVESGYLRRVDYLAMSAHKLHGPKGAGALYAASPGKLHPMVFGGGQEGGIRSGTENVPGIAGFGACAQAASADIVGHAKQANLCRRRLLEGITAEIPYVQVNSPEDASVTGKPGCSSPYILNASFIGARAEVLVHELERSGIFVSTGAACSSLGKDGEKQSTTLAAIGASGEARESALRFGLSWTNTIEEMDFVIERLSAAVARFRRTGLNR